MGAGDVDFSSSLGNSQRPMALRTVIVSVSGVLLLAYLFGYKASPRLTFFHKISVFLASFCNIF